MSRSALALFALYFALPAVLALVVLRLRHLLPGWLTQVLGMLMLPWAILLSVTATTAGYLIPACALAIGIVLFVAWRLLTGRGGSRRGAGSR